MAAHFSAPLMPSFRHFTVLNLNAEIFLAEAAVDRAKESDCEPLLAELAALNENYNPLIAAAGLLRGIPEHLFPRMKLSCESTGEVELALLPDTAAEMVSFLKLLPPHPLGHTASNKAAPHVAGDSASFRTFPYVLRIGRVGAPACSLMWYFGHEAEMFLRVWLHLPPEWAALARNQETNEITAVLVEGLVPHQWSTMDKRNSVQLYFPKAYQPGTSRLYTWQDVPLLRQVAEAGMADPCLHRAPKAILPESPPKNPKVPKAKKKKASAPKSDPVPPPTEYKGETFACKDDELGAIRLGIFAFASLPGGREEILNYPQFIEWLKARVTEKALTPEKLTGFLVLLPTTDAVFKLGAGEIDWT